MGRGGKKGMGVNRNRSSVMGMRGGFRRIGVGSLAVLTCVASVFFACSGSGSGNGLADAQSGAGDSDIQGGGGADALPQDAPVRTGDGNEAASGDRGDGGASDGSGDAPPFDATLQDGHGDAALNQPDSGSSCRSDVDCDGSALYCLGPLDKCVGLCPPFQPCTTDVQCDAGICRLAPPSVLSCAGPSLCFAPCQRD